MKAYPFDGFSSVEQIENSYRKYDEVFPVKGKYVLESMSVTEQIFSINNVGEASIRFDFLLPQFALLAELTLNPLELHSKSNSASNDITVKVNQWAKSATGISNAVVGDQ